MKNNSAKLRAVRPGFQDCVDDHLESMAVVIRTLAAASAHISNVLEVAQGDRNPAVSFSKTDLCPALKLTLEMCCP